MAVKQYEIYWVDLNPTRGSEMNKIRPCVVVNPGDMNKYLDTIIVAPLTTAKRNYPFRVSCNFGNIALDQLRSVDKTRFKDFIQKLSSIDIIEVKHILNEMLVK
jgi:mRNA interferase MazF